MYITINNIIGEKTIDLSYAIQNCDYTKEIAVVSMFSDNLICEIQNIKSGEEEDNKQTFTKDDKRPTKKNISWRELLNHLYWKSSITLKKERDYKIIKQNKLACITELNFNLNELDNLHNLEDGQPSNILLKYKITDNEHFTYYEPTTPRYKKLKTGELNSLTFIVTDQKKNIINDGPVITLVIHIR